MLFFETTSRGCGAPASLRQIAEATTAKIRVRGKGSALASFYKIRLDQVHLKLCTPSKQFVFEIVKLLNYDFREN